MADMIKFYKGLEASLPAAGTNGALYITTDEGAIYLGTGTGMKRLGDFVQVANVAALPAKAHENCLYYCVAENILAKWNGTEWKQVNKQPTTEELKTLLGLGTMAYKSEIAEDDLSTELAEKVNAAAEGNHSHSNKGVLDGITAEKVTAWDAAEKNAKDYADGLNTAMNTRVEALEAVDHTHANKALLDTYTQTEENLADAVAKKHEHANKTELDKIAAGDVAKWNGVVADHLVAADKTELADSIGDVNTALGEEVTRAKAAEKANADAIASIKDGTAVDSFADVEAELAKKVDKVTGKSLVDDAEITKLAGVSAGANKVEASTNGKIKIDGVDTVVYTHPEKHTIAEVDGLQDALDGKQAVGNYSVEGHKHVKADITDFAHTHTASEITDLDATIKGYNYATKTEAEGYANAKDEAIAAAKKAGDDAQKAADDLATYVGTFTASEGIDTVVKYIDAKTANIASDERVNGIDERLTQAEKDIDALEQASATHAIKTEVEGALALKADKSVVDAMYTNEQIDGFIAEAKKHADDNDANTTYTIGYESKVDGEDGHPARIVLTPSEGDAQYIDATPFIKDGMLDNVAYNADTNTLTFTFNTDAGKEAVTVELTDILAPYTGSTGERIKVEVTDGVISADLIAGSISKDYLDDGVKASLALADSAIQSHQDISHLATTEALNGVDAKFANYTNTTDMNTALDLKADKTQVATDIATAKSGAEAEAARLDAALKTELQGEIDADVKALADTVYTKTETFTKDEVNAAIEAAVTAATEWGSF
jgi:hypothetical protein